LLDSEGNISKLAEAKTMLVQLERNNETSTQFEFWSVCLVADRITARQANDLLRDKLTEFSSQIAELQDRKRNLENTLESKERAHRRALEDLYNASAVFLSIRGVLVSQTYQMLW